MFTTVLLLPVFMLCFADARTQLVPLDAPDLPEAITVGQEATPHSWPWQVTLTIFEGDSKRSCGGSLIRRDVVLTTAYCVYLADKVVVKLGVHNISAEESTLQEIKAKTIVAHPLFNGYDVDYDIGLVILKEFPSLKDGTVKPIPRLSTKKLDKKALDPGRECFVTGWGSTRNSDGSYSRSEVLRELKTEVITDKRCGRMDPTEPPKVQDNICTLTRNDGICFGDGGGPLVCKINSQWTQLGITAYLEPFSVCVGGINGYTRVSSYRRWIRSVLN